MDKEIYLGDGLYASYNGYSITLRAPREEGNHIVVLDYEIYANLAAFAKKSFGI